MTHGHWRNPTAIRLIDHERRDLSRAPAVAVRRTPPSLRVRFNFTTLPDPPDRLVITLVTPGEASLTETIVVDSLTRGHVVMRRALDPDKRYAVYVSTISVNGVPTAPDDRPLSLPPVRAVSPARLIAPLLRIWDDLWLWLGSRLTRRIRRNASDRD